jgi:hypothetical protein
MSRETAATRSNCYPPVTTIGGSKTKKATHKERDRSAVEFLLVPCQFEIDGCSATG